MNIQIQISGIENGCLVMTPPAPPSNLARMSQQEQMMASQAQQRPTTTYCATFEEVVAILKSQWPVEVN